MPISVVKRPVAILVVAIGLGFLAARGSLGARAGAKALGAAAAPQGTIPARTVPAGTRVAGEPGKKGDTYYWLEGQTRKLTTRFADAVVVAERGAGGELRAKVADTDGNEGATFTATSTLLQYVPASGRPLQALNDSGERPTLDWANRQAYLLWTDRASSAPRVWAGGLMKPADAATRDLHREIVELETEWSEGLSVRTRRTNGGGYSLVDSATGKNRVLSGEAFAGRMSRNGVEVGRSTWFDREKVFIWNIPNLTQGFIAAEHLKDFGGWPFAPDPAWLNLQTLAFYHFKSAINANGFVARGSGACPADRREGLAARAADFFVPTLRADEPGCDGLHWLDGTVLRFCCDVHDLCYERYGCTYHSWWQIWSSWRCDACNAWAAWCFAGGGCTCILDFAWLEPVDERGRRIPQVNT